MKFTLVTRNTILERMEVVNCLEQKSKERWGREVVGSEKNVPFLSSSPSPPSALIHEFPLRLFSDSHLSAPQSCPLTWDAGSQAVGSTTESLAEPGQPAADQRHPFAPEAVADGPLSPISCLLPTPSTGGANCWCSDATPGPQAGYNSSVIFLSILVFEYSLN